MHSLIIALFISMVLPVAAVPLCDPLTQYDNDSGQCCKMCGPGTRMDSVSSSCQDPLCKPCKDDEYQTGYTTKKICDLHDYCDNNKNKESAGQSKTSKGICRCKTGYHCASDDCITCEPHTICNPGHRITFRGNHSHDTVCQKCPPDTFSNGTLEKCENCGPGRGAKTQGSPSSDTICGPNRATTCQIMDHSYNLHSGPLDCDWDNHLYIKCESKGQGLCGVMLARSRGRA